MSLHGLYCLQLKIIHMPKWHILGRPILNPYTVLHMLDLGGTLEINHPLTYEEIEARVGK